eukprot:5669210-Amphidinium_carterae.2
MMPVGGASLGHANANLTLVGSHQRLGDGLVAPAAKKLMRSRACMIVVLSRSAVGCDIRRQVAVAEGASRLVRFRICPWQADLLDVRDCIAIGLCMRTCEAMLP